MKVVVVTDPVRAYGLEMVSELAREGYFIIAIVKNAKDSEMVYKTVTHRYSFAQIVTVVGDFESIRSLRQVVLNIKLLATKHKFDKIHALICNQEKLYPEFKLNEDQIEYNFFYNYLTNIFLCESLREFLDKGGSRVILPVLPQSQLLGINPNDMFREKNFTPQSANRQAKYANAMMASYFNHLYKTNDETSAQAVLYETRDVSKDEDFEKQKKQGRFARLFNKPTELESLMNTIIAIVNLKSFTSNCYKDTKPVAFPNVMKNIEIGEKFWQASQKLARLKYFDN